MNNEKEVLNVYCFLACGLGVFGGLLASQHLGLFWDIVSLIAILSGIFLPQILPRFYPGEKE